MRNEFLYREVMYLSYCLKIMSRSSLIQPHDFGCCIQTMSLKNKLQTAQNACERFFMEWKEGATSK